MWCSLSLMPPSCAGPWLGLGWSPIDRDSFDNIVISQCFKCSGFIVAVMLCSENDTWECAGKVKFRVRSTAPGTRIIWEVKHGGPVGSFGALRGGLGICRRLSVLAKRFWWVPVT
jgi:hypothetical protein